MSLGVLFTFGPPANATQYYYDGLGRQVLSVRPNAQAEQFVFDSADNRAALAAFPIYSPNQVALLTTNQTLLEGQVITSSDGRFTLTFQMDGDLVLYQGPTLLWQSYTSRTTAARLFMQSSGDLGMFDAQGALVWHSNSSGSGSPYLAVQSDGNLVIYNSGKALWSTNTCCH